MDRNTKIRESLFSHLLPYFEHKRYELHSSTTGFSRRTRFGLSTVLVSLSEAADCSYVQFFLGIRQDLIENALLGILGRNQYYSSTSHTLLPSWHYVSRSEQLPRLALTTDTEAIHAADHFIAFMDSEGFDFLDHYKRLSAIDSLFNDKMNTSARWASHSYQRCFRAMASAHLCRRTDYERLYHSHLQYLCQRGYQGHISQLFETSFARLKSVTLN